MGVCVEEHGRERRREGIYRYHSNSQVNLVFRRRARGHVSRERPHITGDCAAKFHVRVRVVGSFFVLLESVTEATQDSSGFLGFLLFKISRNPQNPAPESWPPVVRSQVES